MNLKRIVTLLSLLGLVGVSIYAYILYDNAFSQNVRGWDEKTYFKIPSDASFREVKELLRPYLKDMDKFDKVSNQTNYQSNIVSGRFLIRNGMSNYDLIQALRKNIPMRLTYNNQERLEDLVGRIAEQLEPDSLSLFETFTDADFMEENGFTKETVLACFMPNTYEFYWNVSPLKIRNILHREYIKFWTEERLEKAKEIGLTPVEVAIMASVVQKETSKNEEKARVAGVYLNRLRIGMPLQADPTVVFAKKLYTGDFNQTIKRVYRKDLEIPSPYNTYQNAGLPPGLIFMPDISSIEAVLNAENHNYLYFCASAERIGYHEFAQTLAQHNENSRKYSRWLDQQGIQ